MTGHKPAPAPDLTWQQQAACRGAESADLFFPHPGQGTDAARRICRHCPVTADCLRYALNREATAETAHGIWGGLSPAERRQLQRCLHHICQHTDQSRCMTMPGRTP